MLLCPACESKRTGESLMRIYPRFLWPFVGFAGATTGSLVSGTATSLCRVGSERLFTGITTGSMSVLRTASASILRSCSLVCGAWLVKPC